MMSDDFRAMDLVTALMRMKDAEIKKLRAENARLRDVLQCLHDNALVHPGIYRDESQAAFKRAEELLSEGSEEE